VRYSHLVHIVALVNNLWYHVKWLLHYSGDFSLRSLDLRSDLHHHVRFSRHTFLEAKHYGHALRDIYVGQRRELLV